MAGAKSVTKPEAISESYISKQKDKGQAAYSAACPLLR